MIKRIACFFFVNVAFAAHATPPEAEALFREPQYLFQLTYEDAEKALGDALTDKGAGRKIAANIAGRKDAPLFAYRRPITVEIRGLTFDKQTARFSASLMAVADGEVITAAPVAGRYEEVALLPVLKRQVRSDEVIGEADIEMQEFPLGRTRSDNITDKAMLIGKSPLRAISPNRPIREHEIARPPLITKNTIVQMRYLGPGMEITTTGQAMDDGAQGSLIAVRNLGSKKIVRALVESDKVVSVNLAAPAAMAPEPVETSQLTGEPDHGQN